MVIRLILTFIHFHYYVMVRFVLQTAKYGSCQKIECNFMYADNNVSNCAFSGRENILFFHYHNPEQRSIYMTISIKRVNNVITFVCLTFQGLSENTHTHTPARMYCAVGLPPVLDLTHQTHVECSFASHFNVNSFRNIQSDFKLLWYVLIIYLGENRFVCLKNN